MKTKDPILVDITIKEGGIRVHHHLLLDQIADITHEIESSGIQYAEVCHGKGIGGKEVGYPGLHTDSEIMEGCRRRTKHLKIIAYIAPYPYSEAQIESLSTHFDIGRVGVNVDKPEEGKISVQLLKRLNKTVIGQILRCAGRPSEETVRAAQKLAEWGADIIYLTDNYGSMDTEDIKKYFSDLKNSINLPLGFQGKNNTAQAVANTLEAWAQGAQWLDGALLGMGPGAGVAPLEKLTAILHTFGHCQNISLSNLCNAGRFFARPALRSIPRIRYIDLMLAQSKLDYYPQEILGALASLLEIDLEFFLQELKKLRKEMIQLQEADIRNYLRIHHLDFDVVMEYFKTGKVPKI